MSHLFISTGGRKEKQGRVQEINTQVTHGGGNYDTEPNASEKEK